MGAPIAEFLCAHPETVIGRLATNSDLADEPAQKAAWLDEIRFLQAQLQALTGSLFLEFDIPRMGRRIDAVLLTGGVMFVIEFKVGEKSFACAALDQVWDYAPGDEDGEQLHKFPGDFFPSIWNSVRSGLYIETRPASNLCILFSAARVQAWKNTRIRVRAAENKKQKKRKVSRFYKQVIPSGIKTKPPDRWLGFPGFFERRGRSFRKFNPPCWNNELGALLIPWRKPAARSRAWAQAGLPSHVEAIGHRKSLAVAGCRGW